jgi:hypothetical protein
MNFRIAAIVNIAVVNMMMCRVSAMCVMRVFCCPSARAPITS